jgi:hypothetical protein
MKIIAISFDESSTAITYQEPIDTGNNKATQFRQLVVQNSEIAHHMTELKEILEDLVNDAQVALRNPPERV